MPNDERWINENALTALVLILASQLEAKAELANEHRPNADYTYLAAQMITQKKPAIMGLFGRRVI